MNNSESAKKGFRTFILTLSVSLIVFSAVYYFLTSYNTDMASNEIVGDEIAAIKPVAKEELPNVQGVKTEKTVFGDIVNKKPVSRTQEVLAGVTSAPQTTQSTTAVPATGYTEMSLGLVLSLVLFIGAMVYNSMNPRKLALSKFEKDILGKSK